MLKSAFFAAGFSVVAGSTVVFSQGGDPKVMLPPRVVVTTTPAPNQSAKLSVTLAKNLETQTGEITRERREEGYARFLEGQRHLVAISRKRSLGTSGIARESRQAFVRALESNPRLAEAYTALAELTLTTPPGDLDEAVALASLSLKVDRDNFGAHRILSRLYTIKSRLNEDILETKNAENAIASWKEIARLDPRNAEAWAFLSEFYERTDQNELRIESLKNWLSAAAPLETRFYQSMLGRQENLSPEAASGKLGQAYFESGKLREAIEILNQTVADDPENQEALDLLSRALDGADPATAASSLQTIQQAIFANPDNLGLIMLFAKIQARAGNLAEATAFVSGRVAKLAEKDKNMAAGLQVGLGDVYRDVGNIDDAATAYRKALAVAEIDANNIATDADREFALAIFDRIIKVYKNAGQINQAKSAIEESRKLLGEEDSFSDRQMIDLYRENGRKTEALQATKFARIRFPEDYGFLRQEAALLVELGRVDEGVAIIRGLLGKKGTGAPTAMFDDFTNYLFISNLYGDAKRGKEAVEAAGQALAIARSEEQKQFARLSLATAQQTSGDFKSAETTLRGILAESPGNSVAQNNLGYFLADRNEKLDEALKLIKDAVKSEPENPSYLDSLGWVYFRLGKLDLAEENLKKALKIDATSATIHDHLGDVYQKQGKTELAKASWQKALTLSSEPELVNSIKTKLAKKGGK